MNRIRQFLAQLGGKLGIAVCLLGFVVIFLGWNGAASFNDLRQQFPYLVSGGLAGLGLVGVGIALLLVEAMRTERAALQATMLELRDVLEHVGGTVAGAATAPAPLHADGSVVVGASSYHRPSCRLVDGRDDREVTSPDDAAARGLSPCRICTPEVSDNGATDRRVLKAR